MQESLINAVKIATQEQMLRQLAWKLDEISEDTHKILNRLEVLEEAHKERSLRNKILSFIFMIYPCVIMTLIFITNPSDRVRGLINDSSKILSVAAEMVAFKS